MRASVRGIGAGWNVRAEGPHGAAEVGSYKRFGSMDLSYNETGHFLAAQTASFKPRCTSEQPEIRPPKRRHRPSKGWFVRDSYALYERRARCSIAACDMSLAVRNIAQFFPTSRWSEGVCGQGRGRTADLTIFSRPGLNAMLTCENARQRRAEPPKLCAVSAAPRRQAGRARIGRRRCRSAGTMGIDAALGGPETR